MYDLDIWKFLNISISILHAFVESAKYLHKLLKADIEYPKKKINILQGTCIQCCTVVQLSCINIYPNNVTQLASFAFGRYIQRATLSALSNSLD